jgi:hypothetical protein
MSTTIRVFLPEASVITVALYDILGRHVQTVFHGYTPSGDHELTMNGNQLSSGVYFVSLETEAGYSSRKKITFLK